MIVERYTTIERIINRLGRSIPEDYINETDIIEYTGEVLEHLKNFNNQIQSVKVLEVNNNETELPDYLTGILQVARINYDIEKNNPCKGEPILPTENIYNPNISGCGCDDCEELEELIGNLQDKSNRFEISNIFDVPYVSLMSFYKRDLITPIRLSNHVFFNSIVCEEKFKVYCPNCTDEYDIVGTIDKKFRFNFKSGWVVLSYLRSAIDKNTGYPLIPDEENCLATITYYIKWKIAERLSWDKPQQYINMARENERLYYKYIKQAKNYFKMPKYIDHFQDSLEETHNLIPDYNKYYGFFGNLSRMQLYNR